MSYVTTQDGTKLFYTDQGSGKPVVLIHGWPLSSGMWGRQIPGLVDAGLRVVAYDRRGFGQSDKPESGYDYDTFAADLKAVIDELGLKDVAIVGFSMGGGEVARYLGRYGADNIRKAALLGAVTPFLLKTDDHPDGADRSVFEGMIEGIQKDRESFHKDFAESFYGTDKQPGKVPDSVLHWHVSESMRASEKATIECVKAFGFTDFRDDMKSFTVPTLIVHGTEDATVPIDITARQAVKQISDATLVEYEGEAHGFAASAPDRLTKDLTDFLA